MNSFREKIFDIIELDDGDNLRSRIYDYFMVFTILLSVIPLAFKESNPAFDAIDKYCVTVFIIDYILRLGTADLKLKKGAVSFVRYPFTFMALVDLLCILSSFRVVSSGMKVLKFLRMFRALRAFKFFRYSRSISIIVNVVKRQKVPLLAVCSLAVAYIFIAAMIVFNVEPDTFENFFDALYWSTISLTTLGYGDIYPVSVAGRLVTMISTIVGMAVVALPSGIITAGYIHELNEHTAEGSLQQLEGYLKI